MVDEDPRDEDTQEVEASELTPSAEVLVGGGLDVASAYVPPRELPKLERSRTVELQKVRIADAVNPRRLPTLRGIKREEAIAAGTLDEAAKLDETPAAQTAELEIDVDAQDLPVAESVVTPTGSSVRVAIASPPSAPPEGSTRPRSAAPEAGTAWHAWAAAGAVGLLIGAVTIYFRPWESGASPASSSAPARVSMVPAPVATAAPTSAPPSPVEPPPPVAATAAASPGTTTAVAAAPSSPATGVKTPASTAKKPASKPGPSRLGF